MNLGWGGTSLGPKMETSVGWGGLAKFSPDGGDPPVPPGKKPWGLELGIRVRVRVRVRLCV